MESGHRRVPSEKTLFIYLESRSLGTAAAKPGDTFIKQLRYMEEVETTEVYVACSLPKEVALSVPKDVL